MTPKISGEELPAAEAVDPDSSLSLGQLSFLLSVPQRACLRERADLMSGGPHCPGSQGAGAGAHLVLSQCLRGQVVLPLPLNSRDSGMWTPGGEGPGLWRTPRAGRGGAPLSETTPRRVWVARRAELETTHLPWPWELPWDTKHRRGQMGVISSTLQTGKWRYREL